jgi:iron(III) transport system permease protein
LAQKNKHSQLSGGWDLSLWQILAWALGLLLLSPVIVLLASLFTPLTPNAAEAWQQLQEYLLEDAIKETLILIIGSCSLAFILGVPAAWFVENFHFPGRRFLSIALVLPLAIPPFIAAYLSTEAREKFIPFLIKVRTEQGIDTYLLWEECLRYGCLILLFASVLYPYVFLAGRSAFSGSGIILGEAGRMLGRSPWMVFWTVQFPLARPALVAGLFLVAMEVLNDYGAVKHLGFSTLTVTLFGTWFGLDQIETAKRLAGFILVTIFLLVALERWHRGKARLILHQEGRPITPAPRGLFVTIFCYLSCLIPISLGLIFPTYSLVHWLLEDATKPTAESWREIFQAAKNSLILGLVATVTCLVSALIIMGIVRYSRGKLLRFLSHVSTVAGYASPGTVIALGIMGVAVTARDWFPAGTSIGDSLISGGILWLIFAIVARYFSVAAQMVQQGLARQPENFGQASRILGDSPLQSFRKIALPLLTPSLLGGATLVFVDVCKELPLCLLLRPFEFETLSTFIYGKVDQGTIYACAMPSLFLILLSMIGLILVELNGWRKLHRKSDS